MVFFTALFTLVVASVSRSTAISGSASSMATKVGLSRSALAPGVTIRPAGGRESGGIERGTSRPTPDRRRLASGRGPVVAAQGMRALPARLTSNVAPLV